MAPRNRSEVTQRVQISPQSRVGGTLCEWHQPALMPWVCDGPKMRKQSQGCSQRPAHPSGPPRAGPRPDGGAYGTAAPGQAVPVVHLRLNLELHRSDRRVSVENRPGWPPRIYDSRARLTADGGPSQRASAGSQPPCINSKLDVSLRARMHARRPAQYYEIDQASVEQTTGDLGRESIRSGIA
jgi:hypothetical protein